MMQKRDSVNSKGVELTQYQWQKEKGMKKSEDILKDRCQNQAHQYLHYWGSEKRTENERGRTLT